MDRSIADWQLRKDHLPLLSSPASYIALTRRVGVCAKILECSSRVNRSVKSKRVALRIAGTGEFRNSNDSTATPGDSCTPVCLCFQQS